jgi:uncharacterized membrane protein
VLAPAVAVFAALWVVWLVATPFLSVELSSATYLFASIICHQLPERSFHLDALQLPVCARCLGLYAGAALGTVAASLVRTRRSDAWLRKHAPILTLAALMPTAVTVIVEWLGLSATSNTTRAAAGIPAGMVVAFVVTRALATVHYGECVSGQPTAPRQVPPV